MNRIRLGAAALALCLGLFSLTRFARVEDGDDGKELLSKVSLGEQWYGPQIEVGDLKGRVTLIEFWGYN